MWSTPSGSTSPGMTSWRRSRRRKRPRSPWQRPRCIRRVMHPARSLNGQRQRHALVQNRRPVSALCRAHHGWFARGRCAGSRQSRHSRALSVAGLRTRQHRHSSRSRPWHRKAGAWGAWYHNAITGSSCGEEPPGDEGCAHPRPTSNVAENAAIGARREDQCIRHWGSRCSCAWLSHAADQGWPMDDPACGQRGRPWSDRPIRFRCILCRSCPHAFQPSASRICPNTKLTKFTLGWKWQVVNASCITHGLAYPAFTSKNIIKSGYFQAYLRGNYNYFSILAK